ncbi:O-antigen ligase family protein [Clostridium nigeriense]|uniref:O-antigen ligase family protein n=1 Tax=Clostridium nigeriense TaxID=1805470 RepID=UPI003D330C7C
MEKTNINKYDYNILLWLFAAIPLVDFINGSIITMLNFGNEISIGKFYRIFTIILIVYIIVKYSNKLEKKRHIVGMFITGLIIIAYLLIFFYYHRSFKGVIYDAVSISKLLLIFIIIYGMSFLYRKKLINIDIVNKIFNFYLVIFPFTMLVPYILGLGSPTYSSGLGYTGLYYANNDLSIVLLISTIYGLNSVIIKRNVKTIILFILNLISLLLVGSKTGILGLLIALLAYFIFYGKKVIKTKVISKKNIVIIAISFILLVGCILVLFYPVFNKMMDRLIYFYNKEGNIFAALLSGREKFLSVAIKNLAREKFLAFKILFGVGFFYRNNWGKGRLVEMDLMDIFFSLGVIVAIVIVYYIVKLLYEMIKNLNEKNFVFFVCISIVLLFSFIAGHVAFSALSGSILALMISGYYLCDFNNDFD